MIEKTWPASRDGNPATIAQNRCRKSKTVMSGRPQDSAPRLRAATRGGRVERRDRPDPLLERRVRVKQDQRGARRALLREVLRAQAAHGRHEGSGPVRQLERVLAGAATVLFYTRLVRSHAWIDRRSLALHQAIAAKIEARPELLDVARANLSRWISGSPRGALAEWQRLLDEMPLGQLLALLREDSETSARLRQSSPFAGLLTPEERREILQRHDPRRA